MMKYLTGNFKIHIIIQNSWQLKIIFRPDYTLYSNLKCKNNIQNFKTKSYPICSLTGRQTPQSVHLKSSDCHVQFLYLKKLNTYFDPGRKSTREAELATNRIYFYTHLTVRTSSQRGERVPVLHSGTSPLYRRYLCRN